MSDVIAFFTNIQNLLSMGVGVLVFATVMTLLGSMGGGAKAGCTSPTTASAA